MNAKAIILTGLALGLFGLGNPANADYPPFTHNNPQNNHETPPRNSLEYQRAVEKLRANSLIGLRIVNPSNQDLGLVKDVVFDFTGGHISYLVIEKSSPATGTGPYTAVRPSSLSASLERNSLVLNVSKDRFESSRGFSPARYPNMQSYNT